LGLGILQYHRDMARTIQPFDADIGLSSYLDVGGGKLAWMLFIVTLILLSFPKVMAWLLIMGNRAKRLSFGGGFYVTLSLLVEHLFSALLAPILMLFTSLSVFFVVIGREISWGTQCRDAGGVDWPSILRAHTWHTLTGLAVAMISYQINPVFFLWMIPITVGLVLSIPISALLSHEGMGRLFSHIGLFCTPPETNKSPLVAQMEQRLEAIRNELPPPEWLQRHLGIAQVLLDPYINAAHVSLMRVKQKLNHGMTTYYKSLCDRLLTGGPEALNRRELLALLRNADSMAFAHDLLWKMPNRLLPTWWTMAMRHYNILTSQQKSPLYR
jgi:membrane glycosyltransferase